MTVGIRPGTKRDINGIVTVFLDCWRGSYRSVLPVALVESMTDHGARALWAKSLDEALPGGVLVAVQEPESADSQILGVTRFAAEPTGHGVVHSLYVSPLAQGVGVGARLLNAAADALADAGMATAALWVFRDNTPSIAFYRRQGWIPDGGTRVQGQFGEPELSLTLVLAEPGTSGQAS